MTRATWTSASSAPTGIRSALRLAHNVPLGLLYIDGHLDTYDGRTSKTGEAADMPVAIVAGVGDRALIELGTVAPLIEPKHIALLGYRDEDEVRQLGGLMPAELGAEIAHGAASVASVDPARLGADVARDLGQRAGRFWLSIDVDVLSSVAFAATPAQQAGGLSADELVAQARPLAMDSACVGIDIVCYDVDLDDAQRTCGTRVVEIMSRILSADD